MSRLKNTSVGMMKVSIKIFIYTMLVITMVFFATTGYDFGKAVFSDEGSQKAPGTDVSVTIEKGFGRMDVAELLYNKGIVENKMVFYVQTLLYCEKESDLIAGVYVINTSMSGEEIVELLITPQESTETS